MIPETTRGRPPGELGGASQWGGGGGEEEEGGCGAVGYLQAHTHAHSS